MDLADFRKEYSDRGLKREEMNADPVAQFSEWFAQATELGLHEPNAMTLATADETGMPNQRTVLLKYFDTHPIYQSGFLATRRNGAALRVPMAPYFATRQPLAACEAIHASTASASGAPAGCPG